MDIAHISNLAFSGQEEDGDCTLSTTEEGNNFARRRKPPSSETLGHIVAIPTISP